MIEVLFGESEAASMKAAKCKIVAGAVKGPVSIWVAGKKKPPEGLPFAGWVEGTQEEVICLDLMMDVGNIKEPADSLYRKELIQSMYGQNQREQQEAAGEEPKETGDGYGRELRRLEQFLAQGEPLRIWYSDAPYSRCGFYHLCHMLKDYKNEIHTVKLPEYVALPNRIAACRNWGDIAAEEFGAFLPGEKNLSREEIRYYADLWSILAEDNSPLRAVVNGKVIGVPEDFYDFQIWARLTHKPMKEGRLIGDILGCFPGIGDWWYAKRIELFIQLGKIRVAQDSENSYARMIKIP